MEVGKRIRGLMEEKGVPQKTFARQLHVTGSTMSGYLQEYRRPSYDILIQVSEYFEVSMDYLLGVSEEEKEGEP